MSDLLKDRFYREFLETKPTLPPLQTDKARMKSPPWVVYVQREANGTWGKREFWKYKKALKFMHAWLDRGAHDAAINNRRMRFEPPTRFVRIKGRFVRGSDGVNRQATKAVTWKPRTELLLDQPEHAWCGYCRRPVVFKFFSRHKVLGVVRPYVRRCVICGSSEDIATTRKGY